MIDLDRRIEVFQTRGWCPVSYAHHPKLIKDAIRAIGFRPQMKGCFVNCQRFVIGVEHDRASPWDPQIDPVLYTVEYHEGFALGLIVFAHAWLMWEGHVIDLTLPTDQEYRYLLSKTHDAEAITLNLCRQRMWTPVDEQWLAENRMRAWQKASEL